MNLLKTNQLKIFTIKDDIYIHQYSLKIRIMAEISEI